MMHLVTLYFPNLTLLICGNAYCRSAFRSAINEDNEMVQESDVFYFGMRIMKCFKRVMCVLFWNEDNEMFQESDVLFWNEDNEMFQESDVFYFGMRIMKCFQRVMCFILE